MKTYNAFEPDLADSAAVLAVVVDNPEAYVIGTAIIPADGSYNVVTAAGAVSVLTATPVV
jgi:hypothetical protein